MNARQPRRETFLVLALAALALLTLQMHRSKQAGDALQTAIGRLPSGITAVEAEKRLGLPDKTQLILGVLHNNMMLAAENALAARYGDPKLYDVRLWQRGHVRAAVYVDRNGRVAGRTAWNHRRQLRGGFCDSLSYP